MLNFLKKVEFYDGDKKLSLSVFSLTAFIQSDTILEVLHFDEGRLLQVRVPSFSCFVVSFQIVKLQQLQQLQKH